MGKRKKKVIRVVLDTNVLVSALLLKGTLRKIVDFWEQGIIVPLISEETFDELITVLHYPKFPLTEKEIRWIVEEKILPYFEVIEVIDKVHGVCRDPADDKFISCAISGKADFLVSGDVDLCSLKNYESVKIIKPSYLMTIINRETHRGRTTLSP